MSDSRIIDIALDEHTISWRSADIEQERRVAIFDLLECNHFAPHLENGAQGPYRIFLRLDKGQLDIEISSERGEKLGNILLVLAPFRRIIKDYFTICESYYSAIRDATPSQIETIDMARRSLHNEAAELLKKRLAQDIDVDFDTARRLFTLICVLHIR